MRFPPPILLLACLIAGWALNWAWAWRIVPSPEWNTPRFAIAGVLIALGLGLIGYCATQFKKAQTCIEPWRTTSRIITDGPYRYSRNPIYVAFVIAGAGIALAFNAGWMLASLVAFVSIANKLVIEREERYLEGKFGAPYRAYRSATRRWI